MTKEQKSNQAKASKAKPFVVVVIALVLLVIAIAAYYGFKALDYNYARDDAQPLVKALETKGAKMLCSREDNGRGSDNKSPWYYALFEVAKNREQSTNLVLDTMKSNGFNNFKGSTAPATPNDINTFTDEVSKKSPHSGLKDGNLGLTVEAFLNSTYSPTGNQFCGSTQTNNAPSDKTIVRITLGLPEYK
jgi:hypothetical protein